MPTKTQEVQNRQVKKLVTQGKRTGSIVDQIISRIDPTYNDRRILSERDAEIQRRIDRQLDLVQGVSNTQMVDTFAAIRNNKKKAKRKDRFITDSTQLFTENIGDIFGYFKDSYKNRYLEVDDLKFISKFIPSIGEGVRIYLDSIISSDDASQTITRTLQIPGVTDSIEIRTITDSIESLEKEHDIARKLKAAYRKALITGTFYVYHISYRELFQEYSKGQLNKRRKNLREQNTGLGKSGRDNEKSGAPFGMTHEKDADKRNVLNIATESDTMLAKCAEIAIKSLGTARPLETAASMVEESIGSGDIDPELAKKWAAVAAEPALESFGKEAQALAQCGYVRKCEYGPAMETLFAGLKSELNSQEGTSINLVGNAISNQERRVDKLIASLESDLPSVYMVDADVPYGVLEEMTGIAMEANGYEDFFSDSKTAGDLYKKIKKNNPDVFQSPDGTYGVNQKSHGGDFGSIKGTYLKWIDYKHMVPVEVLGRTVGYFHMITTTKRRKKGRGSDGAIGSVISESTVSLFNQSGASERRKEEAIQGIIDTISDAILDQFNARFVRKYAAIRDVIAECVIANGLVDNDYMIQFIPAERVIEFKINIDDEGHGESILTDAMFPAHQLLSITSCKLLNYINKGGSRTIAHISSGRTNRNSTNHVNRVIRDLQASNAVFTDLLSSSSLFSKLARDGNMALPKGASGERLVEFEVQDGQQIEWNTEYENMLERWCLLGMGIPNGVIDVMGNVDLAKKVVSDNIVVAGRVASLQGDLEVPTTELYRAMIDDCDMDETLKSKARMVNFKLPRPRILANQNDSDAINTSYQNAQAIANMMIGEDATEPDDMKLKKEFVQLQVEQDVPYIDWNAKKELLERARRRVRDTERKDMIEAARGGKQPTDDGMGGGMSGGGFGGGDMGGGDMGMGDSGMGGEDMGLGGGEGEPTTGDDGQPLNPNETPIGGGEGEAGVDMDGLDF